MSRRKLNYNRPKVENSNRKVVLWAGQSAPFTIVPSNFNTKAELSQNLLEKSKNKRKIKKKFGTKVTKKRKVKVNKSNVFFKSLREPKWDTNN